MPKRIPERQCVGCQEQKPKRSMLRIVLTPEGDILIDPTGKKAGRGAYICQKRSCFLQAQKRKSLDRGLKTSVKPEVYDALASLLEDTEEAGDRSG
ncbi:MAG: YlxR family protein [Firmicutes bacterium]|nr:YlxR family protein [Bacillota bacterium]